MTHLDINQIQFVVHMGLEYGYNRKRRMSVRPEVYQSMIQQMLELQHAVSANAHSGNMRFMDCDVTVESNDNAPAVCVFIPPKEVPFLTGAFREVAKMVDPPTASIFSPFGSDVVPEPVKYETIRIPEGFLTCP